MLVHIGLKGTNRRKGSVSMFSRFRFQDTIYLLMTYILRFAVECYIQRRSSAKYRVISEHI